MSRLIYAFADLMSQPLAFGALTGAAVLAIIIGSIFPVGEGFWTTFNIAISVTTMVIGQAVLVSGRRDGLAYHLKMDQIIEALPRDNEAIGVEHEDESTIQQKITETEERTNEEPRRE